MLFMRNLYTTVGTTLAVVRECKLNIPHSRAGVIPLLGEMSAKQTKGCQNSGEFAPAVRMLLIYDGLRLLSNENASRINPSTDEEGGTPQA